LHHDDRTFARYHLRDAFTDAARAPRNQSAFADKRQVHVALPFARLVEVRRGQDLVAVII